MNGDSSCHTCDELRHPLCSLPILSWGGPAFYSWGDRLSSKDLPLALCCAVHAFQACQTCVQPLPLPTASTPPPPPPKSLPWLAPALFSWPACPAVQVWLCLHQFGSWVRIFRNGASAPFEYFDSIYLLTSFSGGRPLPYLREAHGNWVIYGKFMFSSPQTAFKSSICVYCNDEFLQYKLELLSAGAV